MGAETKAFPWMEIGIAGANILQNQIGAKQQYERQKKLMGLQQQNQMALNEQGQQIQLDTWEKTNYPAQMKMIKEAGLNPALLYSKGGPGGTTGGQGGGSAASGQASQAQNMDISSIIQMKAIQASIQAQEAQARKANAEAKVIEEYGGGRSEADIAATQAQKGKTEADTRLAEVNARIAEIEAANTQREIDTRINSTVALTNKLVQENAITAETRSSIVKRTQEEAIGAELENELRVSKTKLTEAEIRAIQTGIVQRWTELSQKGQTINIDQFEAEIKAEYPTAGQVIGGIAKKAYKTLQNIENMFKGGPQPIKDTVK